MAAGQAEFLVDSPYYAPGDAAIGDGVCRSADGLCTLRAAIEEGNAQPGDTEVRIAVKPDVAGTIVPPVDPDAWMTRAAPFTNGLGAYYRLTHPMTIDLDNRLGLLAPDGSVAATGFWVDGPNIALRNFSGIFASHTSFVFSDKAIGASIDGGASVQTDSNVTTRMFVIGAGATSVAIRNYTVGRMAPTATAPSDAASLLISGSSGATISNIVIDNVTFDNTPVPGGRCDETSATTCAGHGIYTAGKFPYTGLQVMNSTFRYFPEGNHALYLGAAGHGVGLDITGNEFRDIATASTINTGVITLPDVGEINGVSYIRENDFDNTNRTVAGSQAVGIYWRSNQVTLGGYRASRLFVEDNYFDGFTTASIEMLNTGTVTVRRNTFGPSSTSAQQPNTLLEETARSVGLFVRTSRAVNREVATWYPKAARFVGCALQVDVSPPQSATTLPDAPLTIDFYYTASATAETYLGSVDGVSAASTVEVPAIPPGPGYLRIQTQGTHPGKMNQPESSAYSRTLALEASECMKPAVTLDLRAWTGVPAELTTYEEIMASRATEILPGAQQLPGSEVWFTYTVANTGRVAVHSLLVEDTSSGRICTIDTLAPGAIAGCSRKGTMAQQ
jgi:adhesin/invasin